MYLLAFAAVAFAQDSPAWCQTIPQGIREAIPGCQNAGSAPPSWCLTAGPYAQYVPFCNQNGFALARAAPAHASWVDDAVQRGTRAARAFTGSSEKARKIVLKLIAAGVDVQKILDEVKVEGALLELALEEEREAEMLQAPEPAVAKALFGNGNKKVGQSCQSQWVGSECESGLMCMVLQNGGFCTLLGSLPEGMQCSNTGNAVQTFCGGGMTCCVGKCTELLTCAQGKAGTVATIAASAAAIAAAAAAMG